MYTHVHLISFAVFKHIHKSGSAAEPFCHIRGQKKIYSGDDWKKALCFLSPWMMVMVW